MSRAALEQIEKRKCKPFMMPAFVHLLHFIFSEDRMKHKMRFQVLQRPICSFYSVECVRGAT